MTASMSGVVSSRVAYSLKLQAAWCAFSTGWSLNDCTCGLPYQRARGCMRSQQVQSAVLQEQGQDVLELLFTYEVCDECTSAMMCGSTFGCMRPLSNACLVHARKLS